MSDWLPGAHHTVRTHRPDVMEEAVEKNPGWDLHRHR